MKWFAVVSVYERVIKFTEQYIYRHIILIRYIQILPTFSQIQLHEQKKNSDKYSMAFDVTDNIEREYYVFLRWFIQKRIKRSSLTALF
jgi:hypothetical protein